MGQKNWFNFKVSTPMVKTTRRANAEIYQDMKKLALISFFLLYRFFLLSQTEDTFSIKFDLFEVVDSEGKTVHAYRLDSLTGIDLLNMLTTEGDGAEIVIGGCSKRYYEFTVDSSILLRVYPKGPAIYNFLAHDSKAFIKKIKSSNIEHVYVYKNNKDAICLTSLLRLQSISANKWRIIYN